MQTKNIFKTLAFAMLMPTMLLTTACSNDDFTANNDNNVTTAKQGYTLPVTVNVTREGDATMRATYNTTDRKLEFSTGDKLFVNGSHASAGDFAGTLTWTSGTTFTGTITTQNEYTGTADALLAAATSAHAQLLPNGYDGYEYFTYTANSGYDATVSSNLTKAFATTKALAVEQFSDEYAGMYSSGFALSPVNAILNFTISGLTASTEVTATIKEGENVLVSGEVTTDGSGNATFAVGVANGKDLNNLSLTVGGNAITLVSSSKPLEAGHVYNISRSAPAASKALSEVTSSEIGWRIGSDGTVYEPTGALPTGVTAVAAIVYVGSDNGEAAPYNHGLALALSDASTSCQWSTSTSSTVHTYNAASSTFTEESGLQYNDVTHNSDTYPAFKAAITYSPAAPTGCSAWFLASGYQWQKMISAAGLSNLGLSSEAVYWSSTEESAGYAWWLYSKDGGWSRFYKDAGKEDPYKDYHVRACLAF